ncbi:hypothetical protein BHM03_00044481 [Ensete ventricosum]|nr:hypothetical protein BHM03_00044481 [Ensete ventricosum]
MSRSLHSETGRAHVEFCDQQRWPAPPPHHFFYGNVGLRRMFFNMIGEGRKEGRKEKDTVRPIDEAAIGSKGMLGGTTARGGGRLLSPCTCTLRWSESFDAFDPGMCVSFALNCCAAMAGAVPLSGTCVCLAEVSRSSDPISFRNDAFTLQAKQSKGRKRKASSGGEAIGPRRSTCGRAFALGRQHLHACSPAHLYSLPPPLVPPNSSSLRSPLLPVMADPSSQPRADSQDVEEFLWVRFLAPSCFISTIRSLFSFSWLVFDLLGGAQVEEAEMGMPAEKFSEVFDLVRRGNRAFRDKRFEEVSFLR